MSLGDFLTLQIPKRDMILSPILPFQSISMIHAKRGAGKTYVALGIANAITRGDDFLLWSAPKPYKVLYIDGEMPAIAMQERLLQITGDKLLDDETKTNLFLITPDLQDGAMPDLSSREGQEAIAEHVEKCDLIIIDNISCLFRSGKENEAESWLPTQDWALSLRKKGKSILFIHHSGKGGNQRGTSKREDIMDTVINLKQPTDYRSEQGARFEIHFEKSRHFSGEAASSFQVQLKEMNGCLGWELSQTKTNPEVFMVAELTNNGYTINEIMVKCSLSKSKVETRQKKARELGLIE